MSINATNLSYFYIFLREIDVTVTKFRIMKQLRIFSALLMCLFALSFAGCSKDDDTIGGTGDGGGDNGETTEFYRIPKEELQDWSDGICSNDGYMLASYDSISNNKHYYIADKENKGFYFLLNEKNEVIEIGNGNKCANIIYSNEGYLISYFDTNGVLNGAFIKKDSIEAPLNIPATRASNSDLFDDLGNVFDIMGDLQDAGTLFSDLINSDHHKFMQDFQRIGTDGIIGLLPNPLGASILTLKSMLEGMNDALYERQRKAMYGDCNIKIEEISNDGRGNINVFVTIDKANTIPSHLYHLYYTEPEEVTRNIVYWGVVGRRGSVPYINYYTEPYTSYEEQLDCTSSTLLNRMLTFEMPPKGDKYIFRAYLKSLRLKDSKNNVNGNHIKYSEKYEYSALDAYIKNFKQDSHSGSGNSLVFKCTVSGYIKSLEDIIEWGIYWLDDNNKYHYFPSKYTLGYNPPSGISSANEDDVQIEVSAKVDDFKSDGYKDIKLGVYTKGGYYLGYNGWSEPQTYSLKYSDSLCPDDNHVHAVDLGLSVKWACCNVGANSPEEYGDYFAWGETTPKSTYTFENSKTYKKNIGDISGNAAYDAATANWGGSWRMPTYDECQELVDKCTWQWTTQNGVKGCKVTSNKNGNSIFLPATGLRAGELLYEASDGEYWTDTTYPYDPSNQYACILYFVPGGGNGVGARQSRSYGNCIRPVKE